MAFSLRKNEFFANLPPPAECLAILVGCAEVFAFGLAGLANPQEFSNGLGIPIDAPKEDEQPSEQQKTQTALVQAIAARNLSHGALIFAFACYARDRRALGYAIGSGLITTLSDFLIVRAYGVQSGAAIHALGALNTVLLSGSLLLWGRHDKFW